MKQIFAERNKKKLSLLEAAPLSEFLRSRLLGGVGRLDTANQISMDLTLFFLAVPATELNHNSGKPTGVSLWDADGFLSILGHAILHLSV